MSEKLDELPDNIKDASEISYALKKLIKSGKDLTRDEITCPTFKILKITPNILHLTDKAKKTLSIKSDGIIYQYNEKFSPAKNEFYEEDSKLKYIVDVLKYLDVVDATDIINTYGPVYIRQASIAMNFGLQVESADLNVGVDIVIKLINELVDADCIKACFCEPVIMSFANGKLGIITYLNIVQDKEDYVKSNYGQFIFEQCETPINIEDIV